MSARLSDTAFILRVVGVDVKTGSVFCAHCDDMIYNPTVDHAYTAASVEAEENETRFQGVWSELLVLFHSI